VANNPNWKEAYHRASVATTIVKGLESDISFETGTIEAVIASLESERVTRPPKSEVDLMEVWQEHLAGKRPEIERKHLRGMFWLPEISLTKPFQNYIANSKIPLRRSAIKGFVGCVLLKWNRIPKQDLQALEKLIINQSNTGYIEKVKPHLFHPEAIDRTSRVFIENRCTSGKLIEEIFGIPASGTEYSETVIERAGLTDYRAILSADRTYRNWFYEHVLRQSEKKTLVKILGLVFKELGDDVPEHVKDELKDFIILHPSLGDPRLPAKEPNWLGAEEVMLRVLEWLSEGDINVFFNLFVSDKTDSQGRKAFWLRYAHRVRRTRVIVAPNDETKRQSLKNKDSQLFGKFRYSETTAFVLDFGSVKVVEFGAAGHACYIYESKSGWKLNDSKEFWKTCFTEKELKDRDSASQRLTHFTSGRRRRWEQEFEQKLALYGVRPKSASHGYY